MRSKFLFVAALAAALTLFGLGSVWAHIDVPMLDKDGNPIPSGQNTPYSPKNTCTGCHLNCAESIAAGDVVVGPPSTYCANETQRQALLTATAGKTEYGWGTQTSIHEQGYIDPVTGQVVFTEYDTTSYAHGISVGKHSNQGRNEDYTEAIRENIDHLWFFTSTLGMFGKY